MSSEFHSVSTANNILHQADTTKYRSKNLALIHKYFILMMHGRACPMISDGLDCRNESLVMIRCKKTFCLPWVQLSKVKKLQCLWQLISLFLDHSQGIIVAGSNATEWHLAMTTIDIIVRISPYPFRVTAAKLRHT